VAPIVVEKEVFKKKKIKKQKHLELVPGVKLGGSALALTATMNVRKEG